MVAVMGQMEVQPDVVIVTNRYEWMKEVVAEIQWDFQQIEMVSAGIG